MSHVAAKHLTPAWNLFQAVFCLVHMNLPGFRTLTSAELLFH